jgi:Protein of unknown function (DUF4232)
MPPTTTAAPTTAEAAPPSPSAPLLTAQRARCHVGQLSVGLGRAGVAAGGAGQVVTFTNTSRLSCTLRGYPQLVMVTATGRPLVTHLHRWVPADPPPPVRTVTIAPHGEASFAVLYANPGNYDYNGRDHCPTSANVEITPPAASGHLTISWHLSGYGGTIEHFRCGDLSATSMYPGTGRP